MADHRHKRDTNARVSLLRARNRVASSLRPSRRAGLVAAPIATLATLGVVGAGVLAADPGARELIATAPVASAAGAVDLHREALVSRSETRDALLDQARSTQQRARADQARAERRATARAVARADQHRWATTDLNLWPTSTEDQDQVGAVKAGAKVLVTGRSADGRTEVVVDGRSRWVTSGYLAQEKPLAIAAGLSAAPCPDGSVESGLTANAVRVYRAVCHAFPQITSYGGWDNHGEHSSGRALDIMTSNQALGWQIAKYLQAHAGELHLYDILFAQHIWTPVRAGEGWRVFPNRGSATANHFDHVHVSTY